MSKVLIVNQDVELANLIGLIFHLKGYHVHLAYDAKSGGEQMALVRPDLLIASKQQVENDPHAFDAARSNHTCPLLLICDSPGCTAEALFRPDLLPFPFDPRELVSRGEEALEVPRAV